MGQVETRQIERDSLLLMAAVRVDRGGPGHRVKVRNLSPGGMMAEGDVRVCRGAPVTVELRNIGEVDGSVAWIQDNRFGVAFAEEIDPKLARAPVATGPGDRERQGEKRQRNVKPRAHGVMPKASTAAAKDQIVRSLPSY